MASETNHFFFDGNFYFQINICYYLFVGHLFSEREKVSKSSASLHILSDCSPADSDFFQL